MSSATPNPIMPPAGGGLPRIQPVSAFGVFICCVGQIWTIISYMQLNNAVNQLNPAANLQWWTLFVPIYGNLYLSNVVKAINDLAQQRGVAKPPVDDNIVIHLLVPFLTLYNVFNRWNDIADATEGKRA